MQYHFDSTILLVADHSEIAMLAVLCLFAFLAGFIDAMVGGGGLIQLPAFFILQPHLTLVQLLACNKTASFLGTSVSTLRFLKKVHVEWKKLSMMMGTAFVGSITGAILVRHIQKASYVPIIIVCLIAVLIYTLLKRKIGLYHAEKELSKQRHIAFATTTGMVIGLYDGLIGPGAGSFLIFAFVALFGYSFLHASANAKVINCVTSIGALSFFLMNGYIVWSVALPVSAANMAGNYAGCHFALTRGSSFIRIVYLIVVATLILRLGYDYL